MTNYTKISKPTGTSYTLVNPIGRETYDDPTVSYDDASVFYDGVNQSLYTKVSKPSATTYTNIAKPS